MFDEGSLAFEAVVWAGKVFGLGRSCVVHPTLTT